MLDYFRARKIRTLCYFLCLVSYSFLQTSQGWSGGAMALDKLPVLGRPTIWITVGQGPTALAVGAGGV